MKKMMLVACILCALVSFTACSGDVGEDVNSMMSKAESMMDDVVSNITGGADSSMPDSSRDNSSATSSRKDNITSDYMPNVDSSEVPANTAVTSLEQLPTKKQGWGQGTQTDALNRPISGDTFNEKYGKYDAIFIGDKENKKLYLTFDEGYENGYTAKILDVLKEKQVSAVFFVTRDYVKSNEALVRRMIDEGHIVGNHSWTHPSMPTLTTEKATAEIQKLDAYMQENFGYKMTLFRPPMGEFSEKSLAVTQSLGYKSVFWSFAYKDWDTKTQPETETALKKTVSCLHPGAIYLLHAVSETNTNILGEFIDTVRAKGYTFCKFDL